MVLSSKKRSNRNSVKSQAKVNRAVFENLEKRQLLSGVSPTLTSYTSTVTDIQTGGAFSTTSAYVNGGINSTSGAFQFPAFAIAEFDPSNSTIYPGSNLLVNPSAATLAATTGGSLTSGTTIFVQYTYTNAAGGQTAASTAGTVALSGTNTAVKVTAAALPTTATGIDIYASTSAGTEKLIGSSTSNVFTITTTPAGSTAAPTTNTTGSQVITTPSAISLSLINNPDSFNSSTGTTGNVASGSFDVYLLPTYTVPIGTNFIYNTSNAVGLPLGLQGQGGLSGVTASNFDLGTFTPSATGVINISTLTLPTGTSSAATTLTTDLNTNAPFELAIVPHTVTSFAQFEGEFNYAADSGSTVPPVMTSSGEGVTADDQSFDESPQLSLTVNAAAENFTTPYAAISVDQDNVDNVAEIDVQRNGYTGDTGTVSWATTGITGVAGTDYGTPFNSSELSGTVTFAPGQTEAVISIPTIDTGGAPDKTFSVTLSAPTGTNATLGAQTVSTVTIVGATNEADTIDGPVADESGNNSFILGSSALSVQIAHTTTSTYATVNGSVQNGSGDIETDELGSTEGANIVDAASQFGTQAYDVLTFNTSAVQQQQSVTGLTSLSLELDNYSSLNEYADGTQFITPNSQTYGNFNVYLLNSSVTSVPTTGFDFEGQDVNSGGIGVTSDNPSTGGQGTPILLGTASFSDQLTTGSTRGEDGNTEGVQDVYTLELTNATAITALEADLNATSTLSPGQVRLAITAGSPAFAADFANNNSGTGGNFGIQPYLWFNGTAVHANLPAESIAINYSTISVNSNESVVAVDLVRTPPPGGFIGDTATVTYSVSGGAGVYAGASTGTATFQPNASVTTILLPLIPNPGATTEHDFTIKLTGATASSGDATSPDLTDSTTIEVVPTVAVTASSTGTSTTTAVSSQNGAAEVGSSSLFTGYAYLNGSVANGTGSFAFQGYQVLEFTPSSFLTPGAQTISSLTDLSIGLGNYENQISAPNSNYGGPPGDFTIYLAGSDESTQEETTNGSFGNSASGATASGDPATYSNAVGVDDGIGGFVDTGTGPGPFSAPTGSTPTNAVKTTDYAIPLGTFSFNAELGLDYFTPSSAALNKVWTIPNPTPGSGPVTESALQFIENQINANENVRFLVAPGNSAFHAYFWGDNSGTSSGGPEAPQLVVADTVLDIHTLESIGFSASSYNVLDAVGGNSITIPVTRSILDDTSPPNGLGDQETVVYTITSGNAVAGTNYTNPGGSPTGTLTFLAGSNTPTTNITIPISYVTYAADQGGAKAFSIALSSPATTGSTSSYATPVLGTNATATVFITASANNAETLSQYDSSVGDIGTNGPVTFGGSALNPAPPFNFSIFTGGRYAALDFNDSTVQGYNDPGEFNSLTGPLTPTGGDDSNGNPTYVPKNLTSGINSSNNTATSAGGTGNLVYTAAGDGSLYSSTITAINEITLSFNNFYNSTPGMSLNVYLVGDATSNILPGAEGTSKNPHFYDTSIHNISATLGDGVDGPSTGFSGLATQFGSITTLGTITNPSPQTAVNFTGYTTVAMTSFNATAEATLISDLQSGTKFRLIVAPESSNTSGNADWIYGYTNENASFGVATGTPINYYVNPELSFDVSYQSSYTLPSYITPSANADYLWNPTTGTLTLTNGSLTFTSDVANDTTDTGANLLPVNLIVNGSTAAAYFDSSEHLAGLTVENGALAQVVSLGAARTHNNHSVLVIGALGAVNDPTFSILGATSKLDMTDNDLIIHSGSSDPTGENELAAIQALAAEGRNVAPGGIFDGTWTGNGLTSSAAASVDSAANAGYEQNILAVELYSDMLLGEPNNTYTVGSFNEPLQQNDIIVKYTYNGDLALDGAVDGNAATIFSGYFPDSSANDYAFGDLNGDGVVDGNDATIFSGVFGNGLPGSGLPLL